MADQFYTGTQYKLRAGGPMPTEGGRFVLHTFMAEESQVDNYICTESLPGSEEFRGQGKGGDLVSASFTRLGILGGTTFQGKKVHNPKFIDEDGLGFNMG
jgi:hypothetical protein